MSFTHPTTYLGKEFPKSLVKIQGCTINETSVLPSGEPVYTVVLIVYRYTDETKEFVIERFDYPMENIPYSKLLFPIFEEKLKDLIFNPPQPVVEELPTEEEPSIEQTENIPNE